MKVPQVLANLVAIALTFASKGEVRVQVRSWRDQGHVRFQVRVPGRGFSLEKQGNLLRKSDPVQGTAPRQEGESFQELDFCKTLVECMGGQLWLSRADTDMDTSIFFTLPLVSPRPLYWRRSTDRERGLEIQGPPTGPLILVVEDEPRVRDKLARILEKHGYRMAYAVTADDGLEGAQRLNPALITIDLGLPVRPLGKLHSGLDLYQALRHDSPSAGIPVILVTGHDPTLTQTAETLPPILNKPFRAQQLLDLVADQLARANGGGLRGKGLADRNRQVPGNPQETRAGKA